LSFLKRVEYPPTPPGAFGTCAHLPPWTGAHTEESNQNAREAKQGLQDRCTHKRKRPKCQRRQRGLASLPERSKLQKQRGPPLLTFDAHALLVYTLVLPTRMHVRRPRTLARLAVPAATVTRVQVVHAHMPVNACPCACLHVHAGRALAHVCQRRAHRRCGRTHACPAGGYDQPRGRRYGHGFCGRCPVPGAHGQCEVRTAKARGHTCECVCTVLHVCI